MTDATCRQRVYRTLPSHTPLRVRTIEVACGEPLLEGETLCAHHLKEREDLDRLIARRNAQKLREYIKQKGQA